MAGPKPDSTDLASLVADIDKGVVKIPAFLFLRDLDVDKLGLLALVMILMAIPGTLIGKRVLKGISPQQFRIAFRVALTLAGLKVFFWDGILALI